LPTPTSTVSVGLLAQQTDETPDIACYGRGREDAVRSLDAVPSRRRLVSACPEANGRRHNGRGGTWPTVRSMAVPAGELACFLPDGQVGAEARAAVDAAVRDCLFVRARLVWLQGSGPLQLEPVSSLARPRIRRPVASFQRGVATTGNGLAGFLLLVGPRGDNGVSQLRGLSWACCVGLPRSDGQG
jgi:hypothetical protein